MDILVPRRLLSKDLLTSESFDCADAFGHGTFQRRLLLLCTIATFLANIHGFVLQLIMRDVKYRCKLPAPPPQYNSSPVAWRSLLIPTEADGELSLCRRYEHPKEPNGSTPNTIPCGEWVYDDDDEPARTSIVSDWDLVCQRRILVSMMIAVHSFGSFLFTVVAGSLADAIGRLPVVLACAVALIVSTVAACLSETYVMFVAVKFVSSGSVTAVMNITILSVFEITTHNNRPLHVIFAGTLGLLFSDMWYATVATVRLGWMLKHVVFTFPTVLVLPAFCVVFESPRWLVAKAHFNAAEAVMMSAAAINHFPIHYTALTLDKVKTAMVRNAVRLPSIDQDMLSGYSMRRRALILSLSYFSITFSSFIPSFATGNRNDPWYTLGSFSVNLLGYAMMHLLITRLSILTVMNVWFSVLGMLQCLLSLAVGAGAGLTSQALVMVATALFYSGSVLCFVYTLELFPTAIRGTVVCWVFACGRLGGVCATVVLEFHGLSRADLGHAVAGTLLMASMFAQSGLPQATSVECTKMEHRRASAMSKHSMDYMKKTLDTGLRDTSRSRVSADSSKCSTVSRSHRRSRR
ncbi:solute carrier family 22 member 7-like [Dermacentor andersoni]|uniref:solute carrier family 22 member 7-like n=1 Tax=Dermacentor andersoni TaxID=34620 RepID=UPI003B3AC803